MRGKTAALVLVGLCAVLATLLLAGMIGRIFASAAFGAALVVLGLASGGFTKRPSAGSSARSGGR